VPHSFPPPKLLAFSTDLRLPFPPTRYLRFFGLLLPCEALTCAACPSRSWSTFFLLDLEESEFPLLYPVFLLLLSRTFSLLSFLAANASSLFCFSLVAEPVYLSVVLLARSRSLSFLVFDLSLVNPFSSYLPFFPIFFAPTTFFPPRNSKPL